MERTYVENKCYKELEEANVGIDYVIWEDGSIGYIYFEEQYGNHAEDFHKTFESAYKQYLQAEEEFGERVSPG